MKLPRPGDDGHQPREYVIAQLERFGIKVAHQVGDWYQITDPDGDFEVVLLKPMVKARVIVFLYRRFGQLVDMLPTDFVPPLH